jgi:pilus assembly protein Flp/PilA
MQLTKFLHDESGATAIEYGLIAALVAIGGILALTSFGGGVQRLFGVVVDRAGNAMVDAAG